MLFLFKINILISTKSKFADSPILSVCEKYARIPGLIFYDKQNICRLLDQNCPITGILKCIIERF